MPQAVNDRELEASTGWASGPPTSRTRQVRSADTKLAWKNERGWLARSPPTVGSEAMMAIAWAGV